jgi:hypothetical protein
MLDVEAFTGRLRPTYDCVGVQNLTGKPVNHGGTQSAILGNSIGRVLRC